MITIKALYRGQTRKHTFSEQGTFPTYDQICAQLYRVFPIEHDISLSRVYFAPDASQPARILLSREIRTAEAYDRCIAQFQRRTWRHACIKFTVVDPETLGPANTPPQGYDVSYVQTHYLDAANNSANSEGQNEPQSSHAAMDVDANIVEPSTPSETPHADTPSAPQLRSTASTTSTSSCCSLSRNREELQAMLTSFQDNLSRVMAENFGSPFVPAEVATLTQDSASPAAGPPPSLCSICTKTFRESRDQRPYSCRDCHVVVCGDCFANTRPGFCLSTMGTHVMVPATAQAGSLPVPHLPLATSPSSNVSRQEPTAGSASASDPVVHSNVLCDSCNKTVEGVRHKCLDCPDFDLCDTCLASGAAERHNPVHEFFAITEPGRVIVHTVLSGVGERGIRPRHGRRRSHHHHGHANAPQAPSQAPIVDRGNVAHLARCDLCDSRIHGVRYKCLNCPDFDTCSSCFSITAEQHPSHSFVKLSNKDDYIRRQGTFTAMHYATCNACSKAVYGVRYKCMHPECPDFDLCSVCEAHPIPQHPPLHPLLKIKTPDTVIPTVYRVGRTQVINPTQSSSPIEDSLRLSTPRARTANLESTTSDARILETPAPPTPRSCSLPMPTAPDSTHPPPVPPKAPEMMSWISEPFVSTQRFDTPPPPPGAFPVAPANYENPFASYMTEVRTSVSICPPPPPPPPAMNPWPTTNSVEREELFQLMEALGGPSARQVPEAPLAQEPEQSPEEMRTSFLARYPNVQDIGPDAPTTSAHETAEPQDRTPSPAPSNPFATRTPSVSNSTLSLLKDPQTPSRAESPKLRLTKSIGDLINELPGLLTAARALIPSESGPSSVSTSSPKVAEAELETPVAPVATPAETQGPPPPLSASFVEDVTVPDGQVFPPGAEFVKCWKMLNDSGRAWPDNTELVFVAGESLMTDKTPKTVKVGSVNAGAEVDICTMELKAPEIPGRYVGYWRLSGDGQLFGNSLWIDINVVESDSAHGSDESMAASSIIVMPTPLGGEGTRQLATSTTAHTESVTARSTATGLTTTDDGDTVSDAGSDDSSLSMISMPSSSPSIDGQDEDMWHDSRSHLTSTVASAASPRQQTQGVQASSRPSGQRPPVPHADAADSNDFVMLYDETSSEDE